MEDENTIISASNTIRTLANPRSLASFNMMTSPDRDAMNSSKKELSIVIPANTEFKIQTARKLDPDNPESEQQLILTLTSPSNQINFLENTLNSKKLF